MYGLKKEFESSTVNEPSVFEPLKLYCIFFFFISLKKICCGHSFLMSIHNICFCEEMRKKYPCFWLETLAFLAYIFHICNVKE